MRQLDDCSATTPRGVLTPERCFVVAIACLGFAVAFPIGTLRDPPPFPHDVQCAPGSRGNVCVVYAEPLGAVVQAPEEPIAICNDTKLSFETNGTCDSQGGVSLWFNAPGTPPDAPTCPLDVRGLTVTLHGPLCLSATPTP
jgi:hypothetical protein